MIRIRPNISFADRALIALRDPDLRKAFNEARNTLRLDIRDHKKQRRGPDGTWAARASSTKERARSGRGRPRVVLGKLPLANTSKATRRSAIVTSRVAWSKVQSAGGRVGRGARVPARDWAWISRLALDAIGYVITRHLDSMWGR